LNGARARVVFPRFRHDFELASPLPSGRGAGCPASTGSEVSQTCADATQDSYLVKHTTRTAAVSAMDVRYRIELDQLHRNESATTLELPTSAVLSRSIKGCVLAACSGRTGEP
jgi:hypothetical protein